MGDPKKRRKTYKGPNHPWQKDRIDEEKVYSNEYGLKNKKEIWKMSSLLSKFKQQSKDIIASNSSTKQQDEELFIKKLSDGGFISATSSVDDVLSLTLKDILERRLQSVVLRKGLSKSMKQARQFIVHNHIEVNGTKVTIPSYLVSKSEEDAITFSIDSPFKDPSHPERLEEKTIVENETKEEAKTLESEDEIKVGAKK